MLYTITKAHALTIHTNKMTVFYEKNMAVLEGAVIIKEEETVLTANQAVIKYDKQNNSIEYIEATGEVNIENQEISARGDRAKYESATHTISLNSKVLAKNKDGVIEAESFVYNLINKKAIIHGGVKKGVVLHIKEKR